MTDNRDNLVNYDLSNSNSTNYSTFLKSSSPQSFPELMENGVLVKYNQVNFSSEILDNKDSKKESSPNN